MQGLRAAERDRITTCSVLVSNAFLQAFDKVPSGAVEVMGHVPRANRSLEEVGQFL